MSAAGRLCLLALSTLMLSAPYAYGQTVGVMSRPQLAALLQDTAKSLQNLVIARNQEVPAELAHVKNPFGRTLKDDLLQNLMVPAAQARLDARLTSAANDLAAGDLPGVQFSLNDTRRDLKTEIERYQAIMDYWGAIAINLRGHWTVADQLPGKSFQPGSAFRELGITTPQDAELDTVGATLDKQIESRDFVTAMRVTWPRTVELHALADAERSRQLLAKVDAGELEDVRSVVPDKKCVPGKRTTGRAIPQPATNFAPPDAKPAKRSAQPVKGEATVIAIVTPEGCAERVLLARPSDQSQINDAALSEAANGEYLPAAKDGVAVRGATSLRLVKGSDSE